MGIQAWKYSAEEMASEVGIRVERLLYLAKAQYTPCMVDEEGKPWFKKTEFLTWAAHNLFSEVKGCELPLQVVLYKNPDYKTEGRLPDELVAVEGIQEYLQPHLPPCVYFLVRDNVVVYVGKANNGPGGRVEQHQKSKDFDRVLFLAVPKDQLLEVEKHFRLHLTPEYNQESDTIRARKLKNKR